MSRSASTDLRKLAAGADYRNMRAIRRRLPHLYVVGEPMFITFRLHNSLPRERHFPTRLPSGRAFVCLDRLLDQERHGPTYLRVPAVANVVIESIREGAAFDYLLHAWVVMPNHVHLLLTPRVDPSVALRRLKGGSARKANQLLGLTGQPFWQDESYDHVVRSAEQFDRIEHYILQNPVRAGLVGVEEAYPWSSGFGGLKPAAGGSLPHRTFSKG